MSESRPSPTEWRFAVRPRGVAGFFVASVVALGCGAEGLRTHAPAAAAACIALAIVMTAVAARRARRRITVRLESTRAVAQDADRIIWSVDCATIRSVLLSQSVRGWYEVELLLRGGGTLVVPARFDATDGREFGTAFWSRLQHLRASSGYRG